MSLTNRLLAAWISFFFNRATSGSPVTIFTEISATNPGDQSPLQGRKNCRIPFGLRYHTISQMAKWIFISIMLILLVSPGCDTSNRPWHQRKAWKAKKYFRDPEVIKLCEAIEAKDLAAMEKLIREGADVNAEGRGKMTPLLWSFYVVDGIEGFKLLLEHGADPNVQIIDDMNTTRSYGTLAPGDSVMGLCARGWDIEYLQLVLDHGGDPNLIDPQLDMPLIDTLTIRFHYYRPEDFADWRRRVKLMIDAGANIQPVSIISSAIGYGQYDFAVELLEDGVSCGSTIAFSMLEVACWDSSYDDVKKNGGELLTIEELCAQHVDWDDKKKEDFAKLIAILKERGVSFDEASDVLFLKREGAFDKQAELLNCIHKGIYVGASDIARATYLARMDVKKEIEEAEARGEELDEESRVNELKEQYLANYLAEIIERIKQHKAHEVEYYENTIKWKAEVEQWDKGK